MLSPSQHHSNAPNGVHNAAGGHTRSSSSYFPLNTARKNMRTNVHSSILDDATTAIQRRSAKELGDASSSLVADYMSVVEWIHNNRMMAVPKEGSSWDKVLVHAQTLADRINTFDLALVDFTGGNSNAANFAYGSCLILLELDSEIDSENSEALDIAFGLFNRSSLAIAGLVERLDLIEVSSDIRSHIARAYMDLVTLISSIAIRYHKAAQSKTTSRMSVDLSSSFENTINSLRSRCTYVATEMWRYSIRQAGLEIQEAYEPASLRAWLAPQDHILATIADDHKTLANFREEYSCLWVEPYITNFVRSGTKALAITGRPGIGKTVLAGAVFDRLQRPVANKSYQTLFVSINGRIAAQTTSLSLVKSLLLQLLDQRVGNIAAYQHLVEAYKQSQQGSASLDAYEHYLWKAFSTILGATLAGAKDTIVLIDGLDEISGHSTAPHTLFGRLKDACAASENAKLITLSQSDAVPSNHTNRLDMGVAELFDDVSAVARRTFTKYHPFIDRSRHEQDVVIRRIVQLSQGSFLWAKLFIKALERQKTTEEFNKGLESAEKAVKPIADLVLQHVQMPEVSEDCRTLLSFLTLAERPLTLTELRILMQTNTQKGVLTGEPVEVMHVLQPVAPLVWVADELVYIRHDTIRRSLNDIFTQRKVPLPSSVKDRHIDFVLRLFACSRASLHENTEPSFSSLETLHVKSILERQPFLEYVTRYWPKHFMQTTVYDPKSEPAIPQELKVVFPQSVSFALLERTCWDSQLPIPLAIDWLALTTTVRRRTLGENHPATLQSTINTAIHYEYLGNLQQASIYYYLTTKICRVTYNAHHPITLECVRRYLRITESMTTTTRTEIMTRREELLLVLIEAYKTQNSYGLLVDTQRLLVALYEQINETTRAKDLLKIINQTNDTSTGKTTKTRSGTFAFKSGRKGEGLRTLDHSIFESSEKDEVVHGFDVTKVDTLTGEAKTASKQGNYLAAERSWVQLWYQVAEQTRLHQTAEWHERQLSVVLGYANFLRSQKRDNEASSTLQGLWQEFETSHVSTTRSLVDRLTEVAKTMKTLGMAAVSLSIFKYASSYYQSINAEQTSSYTQIQQELQSTSQQVMKSTTAVSDTVLREMFYSSISTSSSQQVDTISFESAKTLIQRYIDDQRWVDAASLIKMVLKKVWPSFFATSLDGVTLSSHYVDDCIVLTDKLAICYEQRRRTTKVENVYVRVFRAVRTSRRIDDKLAKKASEQLISFHKQQNQTDKLIGVYQELLVDYCAVYGETSKTAVDTMYLLGELCRHHPSTRNYWIEYYFQIIAVLNKKSDVGHPDAMEAMVIVANYFWEDKRYAESLRVLRVMWTSFKTKPNDYKQFEEPSFVQTFVDKYIRGLEETNVEFTTIRNTIVEYREISKKNFGATSQIYVQATLMLAQLCEKNDAHTSEAISLYEELIKTSSTYVNQTEIRRTLSTLYSHQVRSVTRSGGSDSTFYDRAMPFYRDRIAEARGKYGLAHEETLSQLREMTMLCFRQQKIEVAMQEVKHVMTEIMTKETSSSRMVESANSLSQTFKDTQQTQRAVDIVDEYHRQIVARDSSNASKSGLNLTNAGRQSLVFLAALEYRLRNDSAQSFSKIMAELTTESLYYEQYTQCFSSTTSVEVIFSSASQLYTFLSERKRTTQAARVVEQIATEFQKREASHVKITNVASIRVFIVTMLEYLSTHRTTDLVRSVSIAGNERVKQLMLKQSFREAIDVATIVFEYVHAHGGYSARMQHGFILAMLIAGRNQSVSDQTSRQGMQDLCKRILREMLVTCEKSSIKMAEIQYPDLNLIISLMGEQQDYPALERILNALWTTKEVQRNWRESLTLAVGRRLIWARYLSATRDDTKRDDAIRLAEAIAYNLRRVHGPRHPATIQMRELVSRLYISTGVYLLQDKQAGGADLAANYFHKAVLAHESILRLLVERDNITNGYVEDHDHHSVGSAGPVEGDLSMAEEPQYGELAKTQLRLLKLSVQRLGGFPRELTDAEALGQKALEMYPTELKGFEPVEKWSMKGFGAGKAEGNEDLFVDPKDWSILPASVAEEEEL